MPSRLDALTVIVLPLVLAASACDRATASDAAEPAGRSAETGEHVATVSQVEGDVRIRRIEAAAWLPLAAGHALHAGDTIQTMDGATATVTFGGAGASTRLEPGTTLRLPATAPRVSRLQHISGRLVVGLSPGGSTQRVEVRLPPGLLVMRAGQGAGQTVEARVEVDDAHTQIAMHHGRADLERSGGSPFPIEESRFVTVAANGVLIESGWTGPPVALREPEDAVTVRTRGSVRFRWEPSEGVDQYQLEIAASESGPLSAIKSVSEAEAEVELSSGNYRWAVRGLRGEEPQNERVERILHVELDRTAPALEVSAPRHGATVRTESLVIRGSTEPGAGVTVDGTPVTVTADGAFTHRLAIPRGLANVVVRATDDLGNARTVSRGVVRE